MANRIDVHSHFLPPDYLAALRNAGIRDVDGYPLPQWTVDSSLAAMDQNSIGAAVLSVSSPALGFVDGDAAHELARSANETARALITAHPDRFGAFALLPLPDVDASLREIAHALDTAQAREPNGGVIAMPDSFMNSHRAEIKALASRYRLPAVYPYRFFTELGGLLSYGNDLADNFRRAATYVDRILKGAKPSELPVQAPIKFDLVINLKTAKALGLDVPATLLARAYEVIE